MFCQIFLCVIISEAILVASSNYNNGLLNTQVTVTLEYNDTPIKATHESNFQNRDRQIFDSEPNYLLEEEHDHLESEFQKNKKLPKSISRTFLESVEVDDDRNKALRQKVESWYDNLLSRRELANFGVPPEMGSIVRFRRNLQSLLAALSQKSQPEWQKSHPVDNQSSWRRQLLSQYSMPEVDYRRLMSLWQKELRRQLKIKWNRRPLVEISPGAFKTDIYANPPDDLAKRMKKLLEIKKLQDEKNRSLNAGKKGSK